MSGTEATFGDATEAALRQVYDIFSIMRKPDLIDGCPCCITESEACGLLTLPLRKLTPDQLSDYASKVLLTIGSRDDFRYMLPRLLDISLHDAHWWPNREVLLGKLALAEWQSWPVHEQTALLALFGHAFDDVLTAHLDDIKKTYWDASRNCHVDPCNRRLIGDVTDWLCAFARAGISLAPFLARLGTPEFDPLVAQIYFENERLLAHGRSFNSFWKGHEGAMKEVTDWFNSDENLIKITRYLP